MFRIHFKNIEPASTLNPSDDYLDLETASSEEEIRELWNAFSEDDEDYKGREIDWIENI
jgi:hypothetical protein